MDIRHVRLIAAEAAVFGMLVAIVLTGCSSNSPSMHRSAPSPAVPGTPPTQAKLPKKIANRPSARKNVVQTKCAAVPGGWKAEGTASNPGKTEVTYKIVVFFTTTEATALDYAEAQVAVEPGETVNWTAKKKFPTQKQMLCPMPGISII